MALWLVTPDSELLALLSSVADEAGVPAASYPPGEAHQRLRLGERPTGILLTATALADEERARLIDGIGRVVIATASGSVDDDGAQRDGGSQIQLRLPASLDDLEHALRWLAWSGSGPDQLWASSDTSRRA